MSDSSGSAPTAPRGPALRIISVNDVYTLANLPRLATLVRVRGAEAPLDRLVTVIAGDFVAPSLLSSVDQGAGMVDCLNALPVSHAIFGNHEVDVPFAALQRRVVQFRGTWLNTNIPTFVPRLPADAVLTVASPSGRTVRVGLIGVVTETADLYRPGAFGGHAIAPANDAALAATARLLREQGCACVIALTHQAIDRDRALARAQREPAFPVIIGGHEHTPFLERVGESWLVKTGHDAERAAIIDLEWPAKAPADGALDLPRVRVRLEPVADYAEDPAMRARVEGHLAAVRALGAATLVRLAPGEVLSSVGARARQTSLGTLICSRVRDALAAEGCLINGGGIRAGREYSTALSFDDLEAELPFANDVVTVMLPGRVVRDAVAASRAHAPAESPAFLQVDDGMRVAEPGHTLVAIAGRPLEPERDYRIATVRVLLEGLDRIAPLLEYVRTHPERLPPAVSGREIKPVLVGAFALARWRHLGGFGVLDADGDGRVSPDDLRAALAREADAAPADPVIEGLMRALDTDHDRVITRAEIAALGGE